MAEDIGTRMKIMNRTILTLFFITAITEVFSQQPFEDYGYKVKVATLSNGKYVEFFDQDSLVQIGSVILNRKTGKLAYFVSYDTTFSEATLKPDLISRWMSPDPLAEQYYDLSPYNYGANNPVLFTDPTGAYITIYYEQDGEKKEYRYEHGTAYEGNNSFVSNTVAQLDYLIANGGDAIKELAGHKDFNWGIQHVSMEALQKEDRSLADGITTMGLVGTNFAMTSYNDLVGFDTNTGGRQSPSTTLYHEGAHANISMQYYELAQKYLKTKDDRYLQQMNELVDKMNGTDSPGYLTNEEKYVNDNYETPWATQMGEGTRTSDYGNKVYQTAGPFTSFPANQPGPVNTPPGQIPPSVWLRIYKK